MSTPTPNQFNEISSGISRSLPHTRVLPHFTSQPNDQPGRMFLSAPHMSGKEIDYIKQAFESNYIAPVGPQLNQFEEKFRELTGYKHCVAVSNGTSGLHLSLRSVGVGPGDTVLASTFTFIGSVAAAIYLGAELVFIDSENETGNMDPEVLKQEVESLVAAGKPPAAVLPTDIYGQSCDLDRIVEICEPHGIPVVCDSAESLGATYKGRCVGLAAKVASFSFNGNKIITTSGGGMVASNDEELINKCRHWSTQAREPVLHYQHLEVGYNYRMSNVLAAIGLAQLEVLKDRVEAKRSIHAQYEEQLKDVPGIGFLKEAEFGRCNRWLTMIRLGDESGTTTAQVIAALEEHNIESRPAWKPMHTQPCFANCRAVGGAVADEIYRTGMCIPSGTIMTSDDISRVCDIIKATIAKT